MTISEFYTTQFYTWEFRGRGWFVSDHPVQLEPPFIPYFRHGYPGEEVSIDDGKRPTFLSKLIEGFKGSTKPPPKPVKLLDYETLESFEPIVAIKLKAIHIKFPKDRKISADKMKALLIMLSYTNSPISFEIIGTSTDIVLQFICDITIVDTLETYIAAYFPQWAIVQNDAYLDGVLHPELSTAVVDFGLKHEFVRPINTAKNLSMDPLIGVFAVLEKLTVNEQAGIQILFQPAVNQWSESILRSVTMQDGSSFFYDVPEAPQLAQEKVQSPLYGVTIRTFGQATDLADAFVILEKISFTLINASKGTANELIPLSTQSYDFETRVDDIFCRESHRLGMLLNVDELITLVHFPSESIISKKLYSSSRNTKEIPAIAKHKAFIIGENHHNGISESVTFGVEDRLKHTHIIGATGTGKSTLIANLMLQDIQKGYGAVLFDPHGDLIDDIIAHTPQDRLKDIVLVDPSDIDYPIGINILQAHSDIEKEVLSSDLVAVFKKYATSWGDQMSAVLGNAIQAILETPEGGTLHDLRRFLLEKEYRQKRLQKVNDPSIRYYWLKEYPLLKTNSIGPILTRLDTFLRPRSIRNMVVQQQGIDFETLLNTNKIILLKLSQGLIGTENSYLLGSLILSKIHQVIFRRQQTQHRNPVFIYLDEFQHFITPSIKEMLSGIRKYNVGLILSHQDLQQLQREDTELLNSVLSNVHNRIVFRVGEPDAKKLQDGFVGFEYTDLQNLGLGEAVVSIEQPQYDCSVTSLPLVRIPHEEKSQKLESVSTYCRQLYAGSREEVEKALFDSFDFEEPVIKKQTIREEKPTVSKEEMPKETARPAITEIKPVEIIKEQQQSKETRNISTHRYLQTLVKKMAEARGYTAGIEIQLPNGGGQVDVLLTRNGKTIAVEICNTTDPEWEMHNIAKCIAANYDIVVSLCGDIKQLGKIKTKCETDIVGFEEKVVHFFTPDVLFTFLDDSVKQDIPQEKLIKGYRVSVSYDAITDEEMARKRASIAKVVMNSLRKKRM